MLILLVWARIQEERMVEREEPRRDLARPLDVEEVAPERDSASSERASTSIDDDLARVGYPPSQFGSWR